MSYKIYNNDCLKQLEDLEENSIDSIVTDPPYELNFMGKGWDNAGISFNKETWKKCLRVLKPGGYLLAFGGSRTYHRIAVAIEDAGFEIRDTIMWLYGSGFPKSMDISKQLDKNANSEMLGIIGKWLKQKRENCNLSREDVANIINLTPSAIYNWEENPKKYGFPTKENWNKIKNIYNFDGTWDDFKKEAKREVIGTKKVMGKDTTDIYGKYKGGEVDITIPSTDLAKQWQGWGTALKPSFEPIIVARKPFKGSLVDNVIENGVGGINIDECRVGNGTGNAKPKYEPNNKNNVYGKGLGGGNYENTNGRFPANTILTYDESDFDEVCGGFPQSKGKGAFPKKINGKSNITFRSDEERENRIELNDSGSAARYFYCAKASRKDRDEGLEDFEEKLPACVTDFRPTLATNPENWNNGNPVDNPMMRTAPRKNIHPTVKPTELMQYLVRLVTPKDGTILDPFMGSGSTGKAVMYENKERNANYKFIGIEREKEYCDIAEARIKYASKFEEGQKEKDNQISFDDLK